MNPSVKWLTVASLVAVSITACSSDDPGDTSIAPDAGGAGDPTVHSQADGEPSAVDSFDLPRTGDYAGIEWTVESLESVEGSEGQPASIRLGLTVHNSLEGIRVTMPDSTLALVDGGAILARSSGFERTDSPNRLRIESGETKSVAALFETELPDSTEGLAFSIDERDHVPLRLALQGDPVEVDTPTAHFVDAIESDPLLFADVFDEHATFLPGGVTFALDWQAERATLDHHFVIVSVRVSAAAGNEGSSLTIRDDDMRLVIDGVDRQPVDLRGNNQPKPGASVDLMVVFEVPDDHETLGFAAGADGATDVSWGIEPGGA